MPLGVVERQRRGRDVFWFVREAPPGLRRDLPVAALRASGWGALVEDDLGEGLDVEFDLAGGQVRDVRRYAPVAEEVRRHLARYGCPHLGLALDRYVHRWGDQSSVRGVLQQVVEVAAQAPPWYPELRDRWQGVLERADALLWRCITAGPLTLHLARASALENAGICLHPLYGFVYLPGTGLKGMARAYAETVWLPAQSDQQAAWRRIEDVFGWAPNPERRRQLQDERHPARKRLLDENDPGSPGVSSCAGGVVFHDAWPKDWPALLLDLVNNHHRDYYEGRGAPGDWEEPTMVSFLAVGPGVPFLFAVSARHGAPAGLTELARNWLTGALLHQGAGAKTAAGYGCFRLPEGDDATVEVAPQVAGDWDRATADPGGTHRECSARLELVTPAFLAGAGQQESDCDLRPATLRGLLRWWWRTMHVGCMDDAALRRLEAAVWGDTSQGGAVRVTVAPAGAVAPELYDYRDRRDTFRVAGDFAARHRLAEPPAQTTQGLFYASYGMNDGGRRRYYLRPGTCWAVRLVARPGCYEERDARGRVCHQEPLTADVLLRQARAALWLLCHLGGVGSKARKGFGSFQDLPDLDLPACVQAGRDFREGCGLSGAFRPELALSASLEQIVRLPSGATPWLEISTPWGDPWFALDQVGFSAQAFAQDYAHQPAKLALGLPRQIHGPRREPMRHQLGRQHQPPQHLNAHGRERHASPVFYHLARGQDGNLTVRVTAFRAPELPDPAESDSMLRELLAHLQADLQRRASSPGNQGPRPPAAPGGAGTRAGTGPTPAAGRRPPGTPVTVKVLEPHASLKNAFFVQEEGRPRGLLSYGRPPAKLPQTGDTISVYLNSDDPRSPQYRWDRPEDKGPPRDRRGGGGRGPRPGGRR
jgi:CRISPR-associated protein Cmr6